MSEIAIMIFGSVILLGGLGSVLFSKRPEQVTYQDKLKKNTKTNQDYNLENFDAKDYYGLLLNWKPLFEDKLSVEYDELLTGMSCLVELEADSTSYNKIEHFCDRYIKGLIEQLSKYKDTMNDDTTQSMQEYLTNLSLAIVDIMKDINQYKSLDLTSSLKAYSLMLKVNHNIIDPFKNN